MCLFLLEFLTSPFQVNFDRYIIRSFAVEISKVVIFDLIICGVKFLHVYEFWFKTLFLSLIHFDTLFLWDFLFGKFSQ